MKNRKIKTGIYRIHDNQTNKDYIGQSVDIDLRIKYHFKYGNLKTHIDRAIHKHPENFSGNIVELTDIKSLDDREQYGINFYNSCHNGYNHSIGGKGPINNISTSKKVLQYDYTYSSLINTFYSVSDAARFMSVSVAAICDVCKGKSYNEYNCYHCNGYGFIYEDEKEEQEKRHSLFKNHVFAVVELDDLEIPKSNNITFCNKQSEIIQKFGFNSSSLSSCIHGKRRIVISKDGLKYIVCNIQDLENRLFNFSDEEIVQVEHKNEVMYYVNINTFCKEKGYNGQRIKYAIDNNLSVDEYNIKIIKKSLLMKQDA